MNRVEWFVLGGILAWVGAGLMIGAEVGPILVGVGTGLISSVLLGVLGQ